MSEQFKSEMDDKRVIAFEMKDSEDGGKNVLDEAEVDKVNECIVKTYHLSFHGRITVATGVLASLLTTLPSEVRSHFLLDVNTKVMSMARRADVISKGSGDYPVAESDS